MACIYKEKNFKYFNTEDEAYKYAKKHHIKNYKFYLPEMTYYGVILAWD